MKKGLLLFTLLFVFGVVAANAQSCHEKAASASKACCVKAEKAASTDATIEKRMDDNGAVSYVRKESDAEGNVKFVSVKYDESTNTFVNQAPRSVTAEAKAGLTKKSCSAGASKACCAGSAAKACCASKATKAANMEQ